MLRFFYGRLEPVSDWQNRLVAKVPRGFWRQPVGLGSRIGKLCVAPGRSLPGALLCAWNRQSVLRCVNRQHQEDRMAVKKTTRTTRGRNQDRAKVAAGQAHEVRYEAKKTGRSAPAVKKAVKKVGNTRKKVEKRLAKS